MLTLSGDVRARRSRDMSYSQSIERTRTVWTVMAVLGLWFMVRAGGGGGGLSLQNQCVVLGWRRASNTAPPCRFCAGAARETLRPRLVIVRQGAAVPPMCRAAPHALARPRGCGFLTCNLFVSVAAPRGTVPDFDRLLRHFERDQPLPRLKVAIALTSHVLVVCHA